MGISWGKKSRPIILITYVCIHCLLILLLYAVGSTLDLFMLLSSLRPTPEFFKLALADQTSKLVTLFAAPVLLADYFHQTRLRRRRQLQDAQMERRLTAGPG
jgi:hypothetical protein